MKHLVLLAAATVLLVTSSLDAAGRNNRTSVSSRSERSGPIARMTELEQRKNAWLRQTFLRR